MYFCSAPFLQYLHLVNPALFLFPQLMQSHCWVVIAGLQNGHFSGFSSESYSLLQFSQVTFRRLSMVLMTYFCCSYICLMAYCLCFSISSLAVFEKMSINSSEPFFLTFFMSFMWALKAKISDTSVRYFRKLVGAFRKHQDRYPPIWAFKVSVVSLT